MSVSSKMTAIADEVRELTGVTSALTLDAMASNLGDANTEVGTQSSIIAEIFDALEGKAIGGSDPVLQSKTVTPTTSSQIVTADGGYDGLSKVTVEAMPTSEQAIPSISVSSSGLITASATQTAGYVSEGTKSATKQLTTQTAKTVTPSTSEQTAVSSGVYTTGDVKVAPIPDTYIIPTGTLSVTTNGTHDIKNYESVNVNVSGSSSILTSEVKPTSNSLSIQFTGLEGEPSAFSVQTNTNITLASTRYVVNVTYDGIETEGVCGYSSGSFMSSSATNAYFASDFTWEYENGTLTVTSNSASTSGYFKSGTTYKLFYVTNAEVVGGSGGTTTEPKLQSKTVTPTETAQTITPDTGYDGLSQVEVEAVPTETKTITESGTYVPSNGKFFSEVIVNVPTGGGDGLPDVIVAGDTPILASWTGKTVSTTTITDTGLSITIPKDGTYRLYIPATKGSGMTSSGNPTITVYKNGVATDYVVSVTSATPTAPYSVDVECAEGDVIGLYATGYKASYSTTSVTVMALIACINK